MRFQKTTEHAIRVMTYMAIHSNQRFSVQSLSNELDIPYKYLGRLMSKLAQAGLVKVTKGKYGGYQLVHKSDEIYLYQIVEIAEGLDNLGRCILGFPNCSDENPCPLHPYWINIQKEIRQMLYNVTLADLEMSTKERI